MVEIRYGEQYEVADLAGLTVSEAREQFRTEFGIPDKARAKLNGQKVKGGLEEDTVITDDDNLSFAVAKSRGAYLIGALVLALAATGGVFAYGWVNATTSITGTITEEDFASVAANTTANSNIDWDGWGFYRGDIDCGSAPGYGLFDIDTRTSGYDGDLVVTVSITNVGELSTVYRMLGVELCLTHEDGTYVDINNDSSQDADDVVLLSLRNGSVDMFYGGTENVCTVRVKSGFYITNVKGNGWGVGFADDPTFFCEVAQR